MLLPIKSMLDHARNQGYGLLRAVVSCSEELEAVLAAAEETRSPVVLGVNEPEGGHPRYRSFESLIYGAAVKSPVPMGIQFDHTENMTLILRALRGGYNGLMIDASHHPFEENVALTNRVVEMCHPLDILVEGEVGIITRTWDSQSEREQHQLTDPEAAGKYVEATGVDALAISIGEVSEFDSGQIDFDRLRAIKKRVGNTTHLCLHGVSFISDADIRGCMAGGLTYFGCATEFRAAFFHKIDEIRKQEGPNMVDPTLMFEPARKAMAEKVAQKCRLLGSAGKALSVLTTHYTEVYR